MSETKHTHTPGPWTAESENGVEAWEQGLVGICVLQPDPTFWGADYRLPDHGEMVANARLIAAAPDLLAACERALFLVEENNEEVVKMVGAFGLWADLTEAIKKARGE